MNNTVEVYQLETEHLFKNVHHNPLHLIKPELENVKQLIKEGAYHQVAVVETDNLEEAFQLTNNIDDAWIHNERVQALITECRSTSVGDLMIKDNEIFLIEALSMTKINDEEHVLFNHLKQSSSPKPKM